MEQEISRKEKRKQRLRDQIMDAAIELIGDKGFAGATTKEIASRADVSEGTLYNYFKNKDDILMSIAERYISYKRNFHLSSDVSSVQEFIESIYTANAASVHEDHKNDRLVLKALLPEILLNEELGQIYYQRIVQPFLIAIEEHLLRLKAKDMLVDYDIRILSRLLYSSLIGFALLEINGDPTIVHADTAFRKEASKAYVAVLGKGMSK